MNIIKIKKEEFMKKFKCTTICINKKMKLLIFLLIPLILTSIILLIILTRGGNNSVENKDIKYKNEKLISELEYRELNEIYKNEFSDENFLIEKVINKEYLKEKDDKINEKNIWLIYNQSYNSQFWKIH